MRACLLAAIGAVAVLTGCGGADARVEPAGRGTAAAPATTTAAAAAPATAPDPAIATAEREAALVARPPIVGTTDGSDGLDPLPEPDWTKPMDANTYWGWMEECVQRGEPRGYDLLVKLTDRHKAENHGPAVFEAVWTRLLACEEALKREPTPEVEANIKHLSEQLMMLGKVLKEVHGNDEPLSRIVEFSALDLKWRRTWSRPREWVPGTRGALLDRLRSATSHIEAGLDVLRRLGDKDGIMRALLLCGECNLRLDELAAARRDLDEAIAIAKQLNDADGLAQGEQLLAERLVAAARK